MTQLPSRSSSRVNRGRPATRIDEDPSLESLLPAHRDERHRARSSKRLSDANRRREVDSCLELGCIAFMTDILV
jgi:hypothetical protein